MRHGATVLIAKALNDCFEVIMLQAAMPEVVCQLEAAMLSVSGGAA